MCNDPKKDYIKELLSVVNEDKKSVLLYVAFDFAVVSLILSQNIFDSAPSNIPAVAIGMVFLLLSAALFFNYYRKMHLACFELAEQLLTLDADRAKKIPSEVWKDHKIGYIIGYIVRVIGLAILIGAFAYGK